MQEQRLLDCGADRVDLLLCRLPALGWGPAWHKSDE